MKPMQKPGFDAVRWTTLVGVLILLATSLMSLLLVFRIQFGLDSRLVQIESRLGQVSTKVDTVAAQFQPQRRGPDPNRVHTINTVGAPFKGPAGAPVTVVEFSDFQ